jgi:hypothetical protein
MNFNFWRPFSNPGPLVYKIWLENDGKPIPPSYLRYLNQRKPRGSQVVLWSSQVETNALLSKHQNRFPGIFDLFWAQNTSPVMRSDILRLLLIFDRGGIYSDHDAEWTKKRVTFNHDFVVWTEFVHSAESIRKNMATTREHRGEVPEYRVRIGNFVFLSRTPDSPILGRCLNRVQERMRRNSQVRLSPYGVLYSTGPDVMTDTIVEGLPDPSTLTPFEKCEHTNTEWTDQDGERVLLIGRQPGKAIVQHEIHGQWRAAHEK